MSSVLAQARIKTQFQLKNISMDQNYKPKYFLGLNFTIEPALNVDKVRAHYARQIIDLFRPYLNSREKHLVHDEGISNIIDENEIKIKPKLMENTAKR